MAITCGIINKGLDIKNTLFTYHWYKEVAVPKNVARCFMKYSLPHLFVGVLTIHILCFFPSVGYAQDTSVAQAHMRVAQSPSPFAEKKHSIQTTETNYSIHIRYPSFSAVLVDTDIATWIHQRMTFFQEGLREIPYADPEYTSLLIDYEVTQTTLRCISLVFTIKAKTGSPSVEEGLFTMTYQAQEGRRLTLHDAFNNTEGLLDFLSTYCRRALIFRDWLSSPDSAFIYQGTTPNPVNFMFFTISPDGLDIYFPPNQVAPSIEGSVKVFIPFTELSSFQPNSALWGK